MTTPNTIIANLQAEIQSLKQQLTYATSEINELREFSLDQWWYSELKSLLDFPEITDDAKRVITGVIPNLIGQIQALQHNDTALKEYIEKALHHSSKDV